MRALVTGGAGFIGSHLVERLLGDGAEPVLVLDDCSTGSSDNLSAAKGAVTLEVVDAGDPEAAALIESFHPEIVFHLAAQPSVVVSVRDPQLDARLNVLMLLNVLDASAAAGVRKVAFASSGGTVYGEPEPADLPVPETYSGRLSSPYGITKRVAHDYLAFYKATRGLDYTSLALANVYGPRQDPHGEAGVIAIFSERMVRGEPCIVYGDGEQTRDYVYVTDVVDAFARAATRGGGEVINIGTSIQTTVNDLYRAMASALGVDAAPVHADPRPGDLLHVALDVSKAKRLLGWEPRTSLSEGVALTTAWFAARRGGLG